MTLVVPEITSTAAEFFCKPQKIKRKNPVWVLVRVCRFSLFLRGFLLPFEYTYLWG